MRKPFIAANWKMHQTQKEMTAFVDVLKKQKIDYKKTDVCICPPFTLLKPLIDIRGKKMLVGAQNCHFEEKGAFTGEISAPMIKDIGCDFVILGHSERRMIFNENDEMINKKVKAAIASNLGVIFCIGETYEQREMEETFDVLENQLKNGLKGIKTIKDMLIAYEPVWAIGTGKTAYPEQAEEVHTFIRTTLKEMYSKTESDNVRIIYGGSVKPGNVKELMDQPNIDGALVGGASLDPESFYKIINY